jgi:subtilisin-like proprotein convertase family protein
LFPGTLPPNPGVFTGAVVAPTGILKSVKLNGLSHTWGGDVTMFLESPANPGTLHTVFSGGAADPNIDWINNSYEIVAASQTCLNALPLVAGPGAANGTYTQNFNGFAGPANTANTDLESIPVGAGNWTLYAYDFVGGDQGTLTTWELCFGTAGALPPSAPTLASPANAALVSNPATLSWNAIGCATSYDVDVDGVVTNVVGTSFVTPVLTPGTHTWSVRVATPTTSAYAASRTFDVAAPPPASTCVANGAGSGLVPATGTGGTGAVWPTTLPATPYVNTYAVVVPPGATQIVKVDLNFSVQHTWIGDLFVVLTDPSGGQHNILHRVGSTGAGVGFACDLNGAYSIYETAGQAWPTVCPASTDIVPGDYDQSVGAWNSGDLGIFNTPLSAIPVTSGNWTLTIYDWAGGDSGTLADWQLCFNAPTGPVAYCTPGTTTNGCNAVISGTANPNAANTTQVAINVANVEGQKQGIYFYGIDNTGFSPVPWSPGSTSFLCVKGPTQRAGSQGAGGTTNACDGAFSLDWDLFVTHNPVAVGVPFSAGDSIFVQAWFRDPPAPKTTNLSNAIEMTVQP